MSEEANIKIEIARQWFIYAQISVIIAGFLFAIFGVAFTNGTNLSLKSVDISMGVISLTQKALENQSNESLIFAINSIDNLNKSLSSYSESSQINFNLCNWCIIFSTVFLLAAIFFCVIGAKELKRLKR